MFVSQYHKILYPQFPEWLNDYVNLSLLQRLDGIGLLCGTDWTPLYSNKFFYSRLDHSVGTALITWNFTKNKKMTLASLFHDAATCVFSHVNDFRRGDALRQEASEDGTSELLTFDPDLASLLARDGINVAEIRNYHIYSFCDNNIPRLCADRLEYMFVSNMALANMINGHVWTIDEVRKMYKSVIVVKNEDGNDELGFADLKMAELYIDGFISCSKVLQKNENKLALNMLGKIVNLALDKGLITEKDCFTFSEKRMIELFDEYSQKNDDYLSLLIKKWRTMESIERFETEPDGSYYWVNLDVKKRYVDPLVKLEESKAERTSKLSPASYKKIQDFLNYKDAAYGAVKLI